MCANRQFLLLGSGEFEAWSEEVERAALDGRPQRVVICPVASAPEGDGVFDRWGRMGLEHYASMGIEARVLPLRGRADAEREEVAAAIDGAGMLFFSGGNPRYLADTIHGTSFWRAMSEALDAGVVYAGCSAGAMVAGRRPERRPRVGGTWSVGLGLVPDGAFGVHWNRMRFIPGIRGLAGSGGRDGWFAGLDERTAILGDGVVWRVFGLGSVSLRRRGATRTLRAGERFSTSD
ncbi:MAG: Type 1 glutamine amidotransferase-like domain-containing protein [Actinomycetota bacterium]